MVSSDFLFFLLLIIVSVIHDEFILLHSLCPSFAHHQL
jgi:hypothetical protein